MNTTQLQGRWSHAERNAIVVGRMGYGDVSSWARATTHFVRPEVRGVGKSFSHKVKSLKDIEGFYTNRPAEIPHDSSKIHVPSDSGHRSEVAKAIEDLDKLARDSENRIKYLNCVDKFYAKCRLRKARLPKTVPFVLPVELERAAPEAVAQVLASAPMLEREVATVDHGPREEPSVGDWTKQLAAEALARRQRLNRL